MDLEGNKWPIQGTNLTELNLVLSAVRRLMHLHTFLLACCPLKDKVLDLNIYFDKSLYI